MAVEPEQEEDLSSLNKISSLNSLSAAIWSESDNEDYQDDKFYDCIDDEDEINISESSDVEPYQSDDDGIIENNNNADIIIGEEDNEDKKEHQNINNTIENTNIKESKELSSTTEIPNKSTQPNTTNINNIENSPEETKKEQNENIILSQVQPNGDDDEEEDEKDEGCVINGERYEPDQIKQLKLMMVLDKDTGQKISLYDFMIKESNEQQYTQFKDHTHQLHHQNNSHRHKRKLSDTFKRMFHGSSHGQDNKEMNRVKTHVHKKQMKQFTDLRLVQSINSHAGAIWTMEFSPSGDYLATGGRDGIISVFRVNKLVRMVSEDGVVDKEHHFALDPTPYRQYNFSSGNDILSISWNDSDFIAAASMDNRVRVYHVTREECLKTFKHKELATCVKFHPNDPKFLITGSLDEKIRLFNIKTGELVSHHDTNHTITSLNFVKQGNLIIAGAFKGKCIFINFNGSEMSDRSTIDVRSKRGKNKRKKVTGIELSPSENQILVSTNDCRIRMYSLSNYSEVCKYKGHQNAQSQLFASFSPNGRFIISGSENHQVVIWNDAALPSDAINHIFPATSIPSKSRSRSGSTSGVKRDKISSYEYFTDSNAPVVTSLFFPFLARRHSGEEIAFPNDAHRSYNSMGSMIITGNYKGTLKIYQSIASPALVQSHV